MEVGQHFIHFIHFKTFYTQYTGYTLYTSFTQGKRESSAPKKGKGKARRPRREKGTGRSLFCDPTALGNQTKPRTHGTTQNDFPVGLTSQPPIGLYRDMEKIRFEMWASLETIFNVASNDRLA